MCLHLQCAANLNHNCVCTAGHYGGNPDTHTLGGYSGSQTAHEHYIIKIPEGMDLAKTAPILCAGVTMYASYTRNRTNR